MSHGQESPAKRYRILAAHSAYQLVDILALHAGSLYTTKRVFNVLLKFCDPRTLSIISQLSQKARKRVHDKSNQRVRSALLDFLPPNDVEGFLDLLYDHSACVFGHVAQEVAAPGSGAALIPVRPTEQQCKNGQDLNIIVHGPDALKRCVTWLFRKGYIYWQGRHLWQGALTSKSDYVVGYTRASVKTVRLVFCPISFLDYS